MKHLLKQLKKYRTVAILAPLFKLAEALLELFVPLVVASAVDRGIVLGNERYVIRMAMLLVLLGLIGLLFSVTAQFFSAKAAVGSSSDLREALFNHLTSLPFRSVDTLGTSAMVTRLTGDINQVRTGVNMSLRLLLRSPFIVFGSLVMAFTVDVKSAFIFCVAVPLLFLVAFAVMLVTVPLYRRVQEKLDRVVGLTRENVNGARVLRAFGREKKEMTDFAGESDSLASYSRFVGRISAILNPVTYVIVNLSVIWLLKIGAISIDSGDLSQGELIALYNYMSQILTELLKLTSLVISLNRSLASAGRIGAVLDCKDSLEIYPEQVPDSSTADHVVFSHVGFTYPGASEETLSDINFTVKRGETFGIIGATGSGKSTLVDLIPHFYDVSSGAVFVDGIDTRAYPTADLRGRVGIVMQNTALFRGTVESNLRIGNPNASESDMYEALKNAQIEETIENKGGLLTEVAEGGRNFSGGQRQRLCIARALVRNPEILILDDSSSALDYATDAKLRKSISRLHGKTTVLMISQRISSLEGADRIAVLDDGKIVGIGKHGDLLNSCPLYRELYATQIGKEEANGQ